MTFGSRGTGGAGRAEKPDYRAIAWLLVAAAGLAACLTLLFLGMRAVMDIGGACASGGPFVPVQPCPDGVPALMMIGTLGLFAFGGLGLWAGARVGGAWAGLPLLAWPALFLSLGWNFLEYGVRPPGEEPGPSLGWLFCGAVFVLMGAVPLWIAIAARNELRDGGGTAVASRFGVPDFSAGRARRSAEPAPSLGWDPSHRIEPAPAEAAPTEPGAAADPEAAPDFVARLERLADLRRRGDLTNDEFETAKRRLLAGDR
jgi:hypothetical protein